LKKIIYAAILGRNTEPAWCADCENKWTTSSKLIGHSHQFRRGGHLMASDFAAEQRGNEKTHKKPFFSVACC